MCEAGKIVQFISAHVESPSNRGQGDFEFYIDIGSSCLSKLLFR
jgi:hypothetical protein